MAEISRSTGTGGKIRQAAHSDADGVAALCTQLGYPSSSAEISQRLLKLLQEGNHAVFVMPSEAGKLAGMIHVKVSKGLLDRSSAEICALIIDETFRGKGLGKLLVEAAEQWALQKGESSMRVRSNVIRNDAHTFYQRLGYAVVKQQTSFRKQLV